MAHAKRIKKIDPCAKTALRISAGAQTPPKRLKMQRDTFQGSPAVRSIRKRSATAIGLRGKRAPGLIVGLLLYGLGKLSRHCVITSWLAAYSSANGGVGFLNSSSGTCAV